MSLLMDALKRAEEAKRQNPQPARTPAPATPAAGSLDLQLEPESRSGLPELSEHLASVDAELRETANGGDMQLEPQAARPAQVAAQNSDNGLAEQAAARNMFSAKTEVAAPGGRKTIVILASVGALATLALGAYFYLQYQQISGGSIRAAGGPPPARPMPPPAAPITPAAPASMAAAVTPPAAPPGTTPPADAAPAELAAKPAAAESAPPARAAMVERPVAAPPAPRPAESPIRVTTATLKPNPSLGNAYQSLQAGDFDGARSAYEQVLRTDSKNTDALTGLATIAARSGQTERAGELFLLALESDPKNAVALTGLIAAHSGGDRGQAESRLRSILAAQPADSQQAAVVQFALGNLYSGQRRWNEAQQAYFQAYSIDPANPDYHYNLAISLDHLRQSRLALQFYQSALAAANGRPAAFDRAQTQARVNELQR